MSLPLGVSYLIQDPRGSKLLGQKVCVSQIDLKPAFREDSCWGMFVLHSLACLSLSVSIHIDLLL